MRAADAAPIHELHEGCVVYRNAEIIGLQTVPGTLDHWHPFRKLLFEKWKGNDWKTNKQIGQLRQAAGIPDHHRDKVRNIIEHLVCCGVMEFAEPDGQLFTTDCYRIAPP